MNPHLFPHRAGRTAVLMGMALCAAAPLAQGQALSAPAVAPRDAHPAVAPAVPVAEEVFGFELGHAMTTRDAGATSTYTVTSTRDFRAKPPGGKIRLSVVEKDAGVTNTHLLTVSAGKHKNVAQLAARLAEIFHTYLAVAPANQEIGQIGDLALGGEIRFFAESAETLRYDWAEPGAPVQSTRFKRTDVAVFVGILTHPGSAG